MKQELSETHNTDANGSPTGGKTTGTGISIEWQNGPLGTGEDRKPPNGAFVEGVLQAALGRLQFYQASKFACSENEAAVEHVKAAINWLQSRTAKRVARGVEGTHEK